MGMAGRASEGRDSGVLCGSRRDFSEFQSPAFLFKPPPPVIPRKRGARIATRGATPQFAGGASYMWGGGAALGAAALIAAGKHQARGTLPPPPPSRLDGGGRRLHGGELRPRGPQAGLHARHLEYLGGGLKES